MVDYYFDLPIDPGGVPRIIHVSQYDTGRMFFMRLVKNGSPFIPPDGTYAEIIGINAKRIPFELSAGLERTTVTTNGVTTTTEVHCVRELDPVVTDGAGRVPIQVVLKRDDVTIEGGEDILGTAVIVLEVHRAGATKEDVANAPYFVDAIVAAVNDWLNEHPPAAGGMTEEIKQALLDCFENVAWINEDGQQYYDALYDALYPPVDVLSISAAFDGSAVIYDTDSLDTLKQYLVVTATMTDSTTQTLEDTDYTLSGTLAVGTSTITVSYGGKTATFSVVVTEHPVSANYVVVGLPTIEGNILTPVNDGYIRTPFEFDHGSNAWEIQTKIYNNINTPKISNIFRTIDSNGDLYRSVWSQDDAGQAEWARLLISSNGTSFDVAGTSGTSVLKIQYSMKVWTWIKFGFNGTKYYVGVSTDGTDYTYEYLQSSTPALNGGYIAFGFNPSSTSQYLLNGQIDLAETRVLINGSVWWEAVSATPTLDDIAFGSTTYRNAFIANNIASSLGDFESNGIVISTTEQTPATGISYKINAGTPTLSTDAACTPTHSLKAFGTSSQQIMFKNANAVANTKYLIGFSVKVDRYVQGYAGISGGVNFNNPANRFDIQQESVTNGWKQITSLQTISHTELWLYIGTVNSANIDAYLDDVVVTAVPSDMTAGTAQLLYENYIAMRLRGET